MPSPSGMSMKEESYDPMDASVSITLMTCPGVPVTNQNVAPVHLRMGRGFLRAGPTRWVPAACLLHRHALGQVPRSVDVAATQHRDLVGQQL